jgi:hypothetical protein
MRSGTFEHLELADENVDKFGEPLKEISTASQWFIAKFPGLAKIWGAPFIENRVMTVDGFSSSTPIAPNPSFMAAVLGHDDAFPNSVVYLASECQFYYYEPLDRKYHAVPDQKLGELMRGYFQRCAMEMQKEANVYHLFTTFCHDQVIKTIVERAKTILRCSDDYFSATSICSRVNGVELHERLARSFCEGLVSSPGNVLLAGVAYEKFIELVKEKDLPPIKRSAFKEMLKPLVREKFNICLRNDLVVGDRYQQGWKDVGFESDVAGE